jgi:hypothetical protein
VSCTRSPAWLGGYKQPEQMCPEHDGFRLTVLMSFMANATVVAAEALDHMAYGCLDGTDFDQIGKVLMDSLGAWVAEADRRVNIANKEQET